MRLFKARIPDYDGEDEDSWGEFEAFDAEHAAEICVEDHDNLSGDGLTEEVEVQVEEDGKIVTFTVYGRIEYVYSAGDRR